MRIRIPKSKLKGVIMSEDITVNDDYMYGGWRAPVNIWGGDPNSIHTEETAQQVGMRGGTIPGTIHLNPFPPLFIKLWGQRWFEHGSLSIFYTFATTDREDVRAVIAIPSEGVEDVQVEARVETPDGRTVAQGTVSVGESQELSYLHALDLKNAAPEELRILNGIKAGDELPARDSMITKEVADRELGVILDKLDWYIDSSPWGHAIVSPSGMFRAMELHPKRPDGQPIQGVGFYGATEVRNVNGPIKVGIEYRVYGRVVCVGVSPRTEFVWTDTYLDEKDTGKRVAEMRHLDRIMKAGSPYYESK